MIKIAWSPRYNHPLPPGHRFPMEKYDLVPQQLLYEGTIVQEQLFEPEDTGIADIAATHSAAYIKSLQDGTIAAKEMRKIGFPYSYDVYLREVSIMQGSVQAAHFALQHGIAFNMAGGTHHAYYASGEGFCIFNDIAVTANHLLRHKLAKKILVIDLDVHQGNGTAALFADNPDVFTFSMHGKNNYPARKDISDLDIGLADGTDDSTYLKILQHTLPGLIEQQKPGFIIYQSGVDVLASDKLGRLNLTLEGCHERDHTVLGAAHSHGIPIIAVMGGGYSADIKVIIEAHAGLYRIARDIYA